MSALAAGVAAVAAEVVVAAATAPVGAAAARDCLHVDIIADIMMNALCNIHRKSANGRKCSMKQRSSYCDTGAFLHDQVLM